MKRRWQRNTLEALEARRLLASDIIISEFMAANSDTLVDDDGDSSDWIELHNASNTAVDLTGWYLTDKSDDTTKWSIPAATIEPRDFLVVYASGKDRQSDDGSLHANFKLRADGEYLGLANQAGEIVQDFGTEYPVQKADVSFGFSFHQQMLFAEDAEARYLVPNQQQSGQNETWRATEFDDASWQVTTGAIGFDNRIQIPNAGFESGDLSEWAASGSALAVTDSIGVEPVQGQFQVRINNFNTSQTRTQTERFLGIDRFSLDQLVNGSVQRASAIKREFTVEAGDILEFDWNFLTDEASAEGNLDFGFVSISPGLGAVTLASSADNLTSSDTDEFFRESGYLAAEYQFEESGTYTIGFGVTNEGGELFDSTLLVDNITINGNGEGQFDSELATDIGMPFSENDSSLWLRYKFDLTEQDVLNGIQLHAQYKDGFSAWLNGQPVFSANAPQTVEWNSDATDTRRALDALKSTEFFGNNDGQYLRAGTNVLAIQGLTEDSNTSAAFFDFDAVGIGAVSEASAYLSRATPGVANLSDNFDIADEVQFSVEHGYFDAPFELALSTSTPDAEIRYTLDGSIPTAESGIAYGGPFQIEGSSVVRAVAVRDGLRDSDPTTNTFLFVDDVMTQSDRDAIALGFPNTWGEFDPSYWPVKEADYEMDPKIVGPNDRYGGKYIQRVRDGLLSLPTMSIVMEMSDLFGDEGIYQDPRNSGPDWERPTSVEYFDPNSNDSFQIDAGIRIQGGASRLISQKQSLRLVFRGEYGSPKLNYPLFGSNAAETFDSITLRSSTGEYLLQNGIHYIRDETLRRSQIAMGHAASHGMYVNLYINGIYWGVYNPVERIDSQFAANYYGGDPDNYDVLNAGDFGEPRVAPVDGNLDAWNELVALTREMENANTQQERTRLYLQTLGLNEDGSNNPDFETLLDKDNYIDYLIAQVYAQNFDWPVRNYYALRERGPNSSGFKFQTWDGEFTLDSGPNERGSFNTIDGQGIGIIYQGLRTSEAFLVDVSDRIQIHFAPGGAFYTDPENPNWDPANPDANIPAARYAELVDLVKSALVAESARWGDQTVLYFVDGRSLNPGMTVDEDWQPIVDRNFESFFPNRSRRFLSRAEVDRHYRPAPALSAPTPGNMESELITISDFEGKAYYTLDGTDPRQPNGGISPSAIEYTEPFTVDSVTTVRARSQNGTRWSSFATETYLTDVVMANTGNLRISEINYNPYADTLVPGEPEVDNDLYEFVEIQNVGQSPADLTGVRLADFAGKGVSFIFGSQVLLPGQSTAIPANVAAYLSRYGDDTNLAIGQDVDPALWSYDGSLTNSGDTITLQDANGQVIQRLSYGDGGDWPGRADGNGSSLEVIDLTGDLDSPDNYRNSSEIGGTPGQDGLGPDNRVVINEVLTNTAEGSDDQIELYNRSLTTVDISGWFLTDTNNDFTKYRIPANTVLQAGDYLVLNQSQFGFGLNSVQGDDVYLIQADENGAPRRFVDHVEFDAAGPDFSFGRLPQGSGGLFPMAEITIGSLNSGPLIGDVVVTEIQYDPGDPDGNGELNETSMEFVELYNRSNEPQDLSGWRLRGDADFDFPEGTTIGSGETLVVVAFDPNVDIGTKVLFDLLFSTPPSANLIGPFSDSLGNTSGNVRLQYPEAPSVDDPDFIPYIQVDEIRYDSGDPWPEAIDGSNRSINRISVESLGDNGRNWRIGAETPGRVDFTVPIIGDLNSDRVLDASDIDLLCAAVHGAASDASFDLDNNGIVNRADLDVLTRDILEIRPGDGNLDGIFDSSDLVLAFISGQYEDGIAANSGWQDGDWNCDREFTSRDLVAGFIESGYVASPATIDQVDIASRLELQQAAARQRPGVASTHENVELPSRNEVELNVAPHENQILVNRDLEMRSKR